MKPFTGSKIALFYDSKILAIQRDEKPGLDYSGMWDLPGGGRENDETPAECAIREVFEELSIQLVPELITYQKPYPVLKDPGLTGYFLVGSVTKEQIDNIVFGDEGQGWELMTIDEFLNQRSSVPFFQIRFHDFLKSEESRQYISLKENVTI